MKEIFYIIILIWHARKIQDYLWGKPGASAEGKQSCQTYEQWLSMIFKKQSQDNFERRSYIAEYARNNYYSFREGLKKILNRKVKIALKFYDKYKWKIEQWEKGEKGL